MNRLPIDFIFFNLNARSKTEKEKVKLPRAG